MMKDLTGQRFGRLVVTGFSCYRHSRKYWFCKCDCGNVHVVEGGHLKSGHTKSCGCLQPEVAKKAMFKHNECHTRLHNTWINMCGRCSNPRHSRYKHYGKRGISVCQEWRSNYTAFRDWALSNGYKNDLTIDRINVNGNYCPENCRWATNAQQSVNKQNSIVVEYHGRTQPLSVWCKELGIKYTTAYMRLRTYGWPIEKIFTKQQQDKNNAL